MDAVPDRRRRRPGLWLNPAALGRFQHRAGLPLFAGLVADLRRLAAVPVEQTESDASAADGGRPQLVQVLEAAAIECLLAGGDGGRAERAAGLLDAHLDRPPGSCLGKAAAAQAAAIAYDACTGLWAEEERHRLAGRIAGLVESFDRLSKDNPDNPFNNWWGVTHASAGLAALAILPEEPAMAPRVERAIERVRTYLLNYGDRGNYYEGIGYGLYAFSHWAPFVLACRHCLGRDPADTAVGLDRLPALVYATTVPCAKEVGCGDGAGPGERGRRIFWNDDGGGFPGAGVAALLFGLAPRRQLAALRRQYDQLCGPEGDGTCFRAERNPLWTLLFYPAETPPAAPGDPDPEKEGLPLTVVDQRTGLVLFRNRYRDADDSVFAAYAKACHGGGHNHEDAGSIRLMALGRSWATGGGQAKPEPEYQCVLLRNTAQRPAGAPPGHTRLGQLSYFAPAPDGSPGGAASLRLAQLYGARMVDRHLAVCFDPCPGVAVLLAGVEVLWDEAPVRWDWSLCFERELSFEAGKDGRGFLLTAPEAGAAVTFVAPEKLELQCREGPASERTFSNGRYVVYPGARYITASLTAARTEILWVMTVQRGAPPGIEVTGAGPEQEVRVAGRIITLDRGRWFDGPLRILPA
ncbi:MAG: hypothetical protein EA425_03210 [Puniceicoccaceae bacterium]|nr:MAG: hypothetical protein EA425_03210 [Puniceicoccaceae bacterium]